MNVGLEMAARVERTGGPRAGLVAYRAIAHRSAKAEVRGKAILGALRCALALRDEAAIADLTQRWSTIASGVFHVEGSCKALVRAGLLRRATELARAEVERHRTARALYVWARCAELAGDDAAGAYAETIARAKNEGAIALERAARARRAVLLAGSWLTREEALAEASRVDLAALEDVGLAERLGGVLLQSPSRFVRASAVDALSALPGGGPGPTGIALVARYADEEEDLSALERDRVRAFFAKHRPEIVAVLDGDTRFEPELVRIAARARDLAGRADASSASPADPAARRAHRLDAIVDVAGALRDGDHARASPLFAELRAIDAEETLPPQMLAVAEAALGSPLRNEAILFFEHRLRAGSGPAPPRGFLALEDALSDRADLAALARRAALVRREPGAAARVGAVLLREGWSRAESGDREAAIRALREAKRVLQKQGA
jgi:hypothetical protein